MRALRAALPDESYVYVADSRHAPYGDRDQAFLEARAQDIFGFFAHQRVKAVVLACNTVSVAAAASLRAAYHLPVVAMEPAIKPATRMTRSGTVLVLATAYTIQSPSVARLCRTFAGETRVMLQACPGLAEQVERGQFAARSTYELLESYVRPGVDTGADTIVLGCTHYAFLAQQIAEVAGPGVSIIEPSPAIARQLEFRLQGLRAEAGAGRQRTAFYTSGRVEDLRAFLSMVGEEEAEVSAMGDWT
ncbi:glutamate racemase [Methylogaea oryzae]|uniref:Glutamate racemase n=1 Tax=Methylogaea oryzae TaxID=1295382 RepID=A0A8D4VSZ7_9GAMM|nr:glutamate racemase [Methylogaea oryzae]